MTISVGKAIRTVWTQGAAQQSGRPVMPLLLFVPDYVRRDFLGPMHVLLGEGIK